MRRFVSYIVIALLLCSCSPRIVEHWQTAHDTTYIQHNLIDSLYVRDSVYIREKNDTVYQYVEKWRNHYIYKTDTLYQSVHDTTVVKETIEQPFSKFQKMKIDAFWWLLGLSGALLLWMLRKPIMKLIFPVK